jgi:hypothetical protein
MVQISNEMNDGMLARWEGIHQHEQFCQLAKLDTMAEGSRCIHQSDRSCINGYDNNLFGGYWP